MKRYRAHASITIKNSIDEYGELLFIISFKR